MSRHALPLLPVVAAILLPAFAQPAGRDAPRQEFSKLLDAAERSFEQKDYLSSVRSLQGSIRVANALLRDTLLAGMPIPPRGFVEMQQPVPQEHAADPIGEMATLVGNRPVEIRYRKAQGIGEVRILVVPNSPAIRAAAMAMNSAETTPDTEVVEVGAHLGVLTQRRTDFLLRFVVGNAHYVEVRAHGIEQDAVLERVNARFLDSVARVLGS